MFRKKESWQIVLMPAPSLPFWFGLGHHPRLEANAGTTIWTFFGLKIATDLARAFLL
jgi:hypothetical protein